MRKYFNVSIEFDQSRLRDVIESTIEHNGKGYVCIVDANVFTIAHKSTSYLNVINSSIGNSCDGSSVALLASLVYGEKYNVWNGPSIFSYYIEKNYTQLLLGSTIETAQKIRENLSLMGIDSSNIYNLPLPFNQVDEFNYNEISKYINDLSPDIIWVSLGAPKQELFMNKIEPFLVKGVMFGIGAAFNFYIGRIAMPTFSIYGLKFIWLARLFSEPRKQFYRIIPYISLFPRLYFQGRGKLKK